MTMSMGESGNDSARPPAPLTPEQTRKITHLLTQLAQKDITPRRQAREELEALGEPAVPMMLDQLAHGPFIVRWEITKALAEISSPQAVPGLIDALEDDELDVRWLAAIALANIGRPSLVPLLQGVLQHLTSLFLRQGVHHVLSIYRDPEFRDVLFMVRDALGPMENDTGIVPAVEKALHALRG